MQSTYRARGRVNANLSGVDFTDADMTNTNLINARLRAADLCAANLTGADRVETTTPTIKLTPAERLLMSWHLLRTNIRTAFVSRRCVDRRFCLSGREPLISSRASPFL